jgi:hypothetical protein
MKQTAVEWLQQALEDTILTHEQIMQTIGLFEQAKDIDAERAYNIYEKWFWDNLPSKSSSEGKLSQKEFYNRYFKMKQTAVEWLRDLYENQPAYEEYILDEQWGKALEMEKEQIGRAYQKGLIDGIHGPRKEYYNQPYYTKDYTKEK